MKTTLCYAVLLAVLLISCSTPQKAFDKADYSKSIKLASKDINKGKKVEENKQLIKRASQLAVDETLAVNESLVTSSEVKDWKKVQTSYFKTLEVIGEANKVSAGSAREAYDQLCDQKSDLDFSIAEYYHLAGDELLSESRDTERTAPARQAYQHYQDCLKNGGTTFYNDLDDLIQECIERGTVYYVARDGATVGGSVFLKKLPSGADWVADCEISIDRGTITFSETKSDNRKNLDKEIEVGQNAITDTSGVTTYEPILDKIYGAEITTTVTVIARSTTHKQVRRNTEECFLRDSSFDTEVSDTYEEIRYEGDNRTWPDFAENETGPPAYFNSNLEDDLKRTINTKI
jgi:hypothetical protein